MVKRDLQELFHVLDNKRLTITGYGYYLGRRSQRLIISNKGDIIGQYALSDLDSIIITSRGISISTSLINEASKRGIKICIWDNSYPNVMLSSPQLAAFVDAKRSQFKAYDTSLGLELIKKVITSKLENQSTLLKYSSKNIKDLIMKNKIHEKATLICYYRDKINNITGDNITQVRTLILNAEANAAREYWSGFKLLLKYETNFTSRKTTNTDGINKVLNYCYAILYSYIWMSILNSGLEPFAGFLHTDRAGKPSLIFDLSEPFKPRLIDKIILAYINKRRKILFNGELIANQTRKELTKLILNELNKREIYKGKHLTLGSIIQSNIYSVVKELGNKKGYVKYRMKW